MGQIQIELDGLQLHPFTGCLGHELQADALLRLQADHKAVDLAFGEQHVRHLFEGDDDFRALLRHALASAQVEGHASPAPVVDFGLYGDEGFGVAVVIHVLFEVVSLHIIAADLPGDVLPAHGLVLHVVTGNRLEGFQNLDLFAANRFGIEAHRGFHRHQAEQLQQVILQHVAHGAGMVVIAAALLDAEGLGHRDLYMIDMAAAPDWFEQSVGKTQRHEVLHGFLAEVVVDPINARFGEDVTDGLVDLEC